MQIKIFGQTIIPNAVEKGRPLHEDILHALPSGGKPQDGPAGFLTFTYAFITWLVYKNSLQQYILCDLNGSHRPA